MTLAALDGTIELPQLGRMPLSTSFGSYLLDAAGEKAAMVFVAEESGTVDRLGFLTRTVTTAQTLKISLQGVNASGDPDGTIKGATNSASGTQASPASNTFYEVTLTETATISAGDKLAIVVEFDSTAGNLNIGVRSPGQPKLPTYADLYTTAWTKDTSGQFLFASLRFNDASYPRLTVFPCNANDGVSVSTTTTPDEVGNVILLNAPVTSFGIRARIDLDGDCDAVLYDSSGTSLASASLVSAQRFKAGPDIADWVFATPVDLTAGTYRVVLKPTTTTAITAYRVTVFTAAAMGHFDLGTDCYATTRVDAGSFTDATTQRYQVALLASQIDDGAGSGGASMSLINGGLIN